MEKNKMTKKQPVRMGSNMAKWGHSTTVSERRDKQHLFCAVSQHLCLDVQVMPCRVDDPSGMGCCLRFSIAIRA